MSKILRTIESVTSDVSKCDVNELVGRESLGYVYLVGMCAN